MLLYASKIVSLDENFEHFSYEDVVQIVVRKEGVTKDPGVYLIAQEGKNGVTLTKGHTSKPIRLGSGIIFCVIIVFILFFFYFNFFFFF